MISHSVKNKPIGGEQEIFDDGYYYGVTNSGRSSLRWIIQSMHLQGKRILIPDFICQVVIDILREYNIEIYFYKINKNFEFSLPSILEKTDAIYIIKYFGHESNSFKSILMNSKLPIIIDDVFGTELPQIKTLANWSYFNSLRKISTISDFSQVISNIPLLSIKKESLSAFSNLKYQAKNAKAQFIHSHRGEEKYYLTMSSNAENLLDNTKGIFSPDDKSVYLASQFYHKLEYIKTINKKNLITAKKHLNNTQFIDISPEYPSFLPLILKNRNKIRLALMENSIFLAIHWPEVNAISNDLSSQILSLPLDSRYTIEDIQRICDLIKKLDIQYI